MKKKILVLCIVLVPLFAFSQVTFYVNPGHANANDDNDGDNPDAPWKTLNINAWMDDATIMLSNAVYTVDEFRYIDVSVTLEGESRDGVILQNMTDSEFLMGYDGTKFFTVNASNVTVKNMTFKNMKYVWDDTNAENYPERPGGFFQVYDGNTLTVENVTFEKSFLGKAVGGAIFNQGTLICNDVLFKNCIARQGGAVFIGGDGNATFNNVQFVENSTADDVDYYKFGGAVCIQTGLANVSFENCFFDSNRAESGTPATYTPTGGAISVRLGAGYICNLTIKNTTFSNNYAHFSGAVIGTSGNGNPDAGTVFNLHVENSVFFENYTTGVSGGSTINFFGSHNFLYSGDVTLVNNTFYKNNNGDANSKSIWSNDQKLNFKMYNNVILDARVTEDNPTGDGYSLVLQGANAWGTAPANLTLDARNNYVDKPGGSLGDEAFLGWIGNGNISSVYNPALFLDEELYEPEEGTVPYLRITNAASPLIDGGVSEVLVNDVNVIPATDIRGLAVQGISKDVGAYEYQASASVFESKTTQYSLYPNPFTDYISIPQGVVSVDMYDLAGRICLSQASVVERIQTTSLHPGYYIVKMQMEDGRVLTSKVQKVK